MTVATKPEPAAPATTTAPARVIACRCATKPGYWERADIPGAGYIERAMPAARLAAKRYEQGTRYRTKHLPPGRTQLDVCLAGFVAEVVVADLLHEPWNEGDASRPDIGVDIEVRYVFTSSKREPHLSVMDRERYADDRIYVLTTGANGHVIVLGWATGREVRKRGDVRPWTDDPGYWLPWTHLHRLPLTSKHD